MMLVQDVPQIEESRGSMVRRHWDVSKGQEEFEESEGGVVLAQDTSVETLPGLTSQKRQENIIQMQHYGLETPDFPSNWLSAFTLVIAAERLQAALEDADYEDVLSMIDLSEAPADHGFDFDKPRLSDVEEEASEKAAALMKFFVTDSLLPLLDKGSQGAGATLRWCNRVLQQFSSRSPQDLFLQESYKEVCSMAKCMIALLDMNVFNTIGSIADVNSVMNAKFGQKYVLAEALRQNGLYADLEKVCRQCDVALQTMRPEMSSAMQSIEKGTDFVQIIEKIPSWRDALRPGFTKALEDALLARLQGKMAELDSEDAPAEAELQKFRDLCGLWASVPLTADMVKMGVPGEGIQKLASEAAAKQEQRAASVRRREFLCAVKKFIEQEAIKLRGQQASGKEALEQLLAAAGQSSSAQDRLSDEEVLETAGLGDCLIECSASILEAALSGRSKEDTFCRERTKEAKHLHTIFADCSGTLGATTDATDVVPVLESHMKLVKLCLVLHSRKTSLTQCAGEAADLISTFKVCTGYQDAEPDTSVAVAAAEFAGLCTEAEEFIEELKVEVSKVGESMLQKKMELVADVAGGLGGGGSWKGTVLGSDVDWAALIKAGKPLLNDNAKLSSLLDGLKKLRQDHWAVAGRRDL